MKRPWILSNHLFAAIDTGDVETAAEVIDSGFDVDTILMEGKSAISLCIERGKYAIAQLLIRRGCSLSLKTPNGDYPLHLAVQYCAVNLVRTLLNNRADVTAVNLFGKTALHVACEMNNTDIARALIERSSVSNLNVADRDGRTPLMYACLYGSKDLVEYLLQKGSKVNVTDKHGESPLLQCIINAKCSSEMMQSLLNAGANVEQRNIFGESPLLRAVRQAYVYQTGTKRGHYQEMTLMLIEYGSNLRITNFLGQSPLHLAVCANDEVLVKKMLNACNVTDIGDGLGLSPLFYACRNANKKILNLLINSGADLNIYDWMQLKELLQMSDSCALVDYIIESRKEVQPLSALSRNVIRKNFNKSIEKHAKFLPIPTLLTNYIIQLDE